MNQSNNSKDDSLVPYTTMARDKIIHKLVIAGTILAGIKFINKMGPASTILEKIKHSIISNHIKDGLAKSERVGAIGGVKDILGRNKTPRGKPNFNTVDISSVDAIRNSNNKVYEMYEGKAVSTQRVKAVERSFETTFNSTQLGEGYFQFVKTRGLVPGATTAKDIKYDNIVLKVKLDSMKQYFASGIRKLSDSIPIDLNSVHELIFSNRGFVGGAAELKKINDMHEYFLNDAAYGAEYIKNLQNEKRRFNLKVKATVASNPSVGNIQTVTGESKDPKLIPNTYGDLEDAFKDVKIRFVPNDREKLFSISYSSKLSQNQRDAEMIKQYKSTGVDLPNVMGPYTRQIKDLKFTLAKVALEYPDVIIGSNVYMEDFGTRGKYLIVETMKQEAGEVVKIRNSIGISTDSMIPSFNVGGRPIYDSKIGSGSTISDQVAINKTGEAITKLTRAYGSAKFTDLREGKAKKWEQDVQRGINSGIREQGYAPHELRGAFKAEGLEFGILNDLLVGDHVPRTQAKLAGGLKSLKLLKQLHANKDAVIINLDLETLNPLASSAQLQATDSFTSIWQAGISVSENGVFTEGIQINSDHGLKNFEIYNMTPDQIDKIIASGYSKATALKGHAAYCRGRLTDMGFKVPASDGEAILQFSKFIQQRTREQKPTRFHKSFQTDSQFANHIFDIIDRLTNEAAAKGKKVYVNTVNGIDFDFTILKSLAPGRYDAVKDKIIDVQSMMYTMEHLGKTTPESLAAGNLLKRILLHLDIPEAIVLNWEKRPEEVIKFLSSGKHVKIHTSGGRSLANWLQDTIGANAGAINAHEALSDSALGGVILELLKNDKFKNWTRSSNISTYENWLEMSLKKDLGETAKLYMQLEGIDVGGQEYSGTLLSTNSLGKFFLSPHHAAHMFWAADNAFNKDLGQRGMGVWFKKRGALKNMNKRERALALRDPLRWKSYLNAEQMVLNNVLGMPDRLSQNLHLNTVYWFGRPASKMGLFEMTKGYGDITMYDQKLLDSRLWESLSVSHPQIYSDLMYVHNKVKAHYLKKHGSELGMDVFDNVKSALWDSAVSEVFAEMEKNEPNRIPTFEPNMYVEFEGRKVKITSELGGKLSGFGIDYNPTTRASMGPTGTIAKIAIEAKMESAASIITAMQYHHKAALVTMNEISARNAAGAARKAGVVGTEFAFTDFEFLKRSHYGSMKEMLMRKAISIAQYHLYSGDRLVQERMQDALKKMHGTLNAQFNVTVNPDNTFTLNHKSDQNTIKKQIMSQSSVEIDSIMNSLKLVGNEAVWNNNTFESYMKHWGEDWKVGRKNIQAFIANAIKIESTKGLKDEFGLRMVQNHQRLLQYMDPLAIAHEFLKTQDAKYDKMSADDFTEHFKRLTPHDRSSILQEVPIFTQTFGDPGQPESERLAVWGAWQSTQFRGPGAGLGFTNNATVKLRRQSFDQILNSPFTSKFMKTVVKQHTGYNTSAKLNDAMLGIRAVSRKLQDLNISNSIASGQALVYEELERLIDRSDAISAINKELQTLNVIAGEVVNKVADATDKINLHLHNYADLKQKYDSPEKLASRIRELEGKLTSGRIFSYNEAGRWAQMAVEKGGTWILPTKVTKIVDGKRVTVGKVPFKFTLETTLEQLNKEKNSHITADYAMKVMRALGEGIDKENTSADRLFDIRVNEIGLHEVTMNGFILPAQENTANILEVSNMHEAVHRTTDTVFASRDIIMGFKEYYDSQLDPKTAIGKIEAQQKELAKKSLGMLLHTMRLGKGTAYDAATSIHMEGFRAQYITIESMMTNINGILNEINKDPVTFEASDMGKRLNAAGFTADRTKTALHSIKNAKLNTLFMTADKFSGGGRQHMYMSDGSVMSFAKMIQNMDKDAKAAWGEAMRNFGTLPGGEALRNPIANNGVHPTISTSVMLLHNAIAKEIGMPQDRMALWSQYGDLVKADTDNDLLYMVFSGYKTTEQLNKRRMEDKKALTMLWEDAATRKRIEDYNAKNFIISEGLPDQYGVSKTKISRIDTDINSPDFMSTKEIEIDSRKLPTKNHLSDYLEMKGLVDKVMSTQGRGCLDVHAKTNMINAMSKRLLPVLTNTMRERIHEIVGAKAGLRLSNEVIHEVIGDISTGASGFMQKIFTSVKSGSFDEILNLIKYSKALGDPSSTNKQTHEEINEMLKSMHPDFENYTDARKRNVTKAHQLLLEFPRYMEMMKGQDPTLELMTEEEKKLMFRYESSNVLDLAIHDRLKKFDEQFNSHQKTISDMFLQSMEIVDDDPNMRFDTVGRWLEDKIGQESDSYSKAIKDRYLRPEITEKIKFGGKAAAIGAAIYLGLNLFRPHQMSNSLNPLDGFINLGTGVDSQYNLKGSDLQLPRNLPLDAVEATFEKSAYIKSNDNFAPEYKSLLFKSNMNRYNERTGGNYSMQSFFNSDPEIVYNNYTKRIGYFNSYDEQRRANR